MQSHHGFSVNLYLNGAKQVKQKDPQFMSPNSRQRSFLMKGIDRWLNKGPGLSKTFYVLEEGTINQFS